MAKLGRKSLGKMGTCHVDIQLILREAIKYYDFTVIEGTRSAERQKELFKAGKSKLDGVNKKSKHQSYPSMAVDACPYPIRWEGKKSKERFYFMMGIICAIAEKLFSEGKIKHKVRFGLDWNCNGKFTDQTFDDLPHFELITPEEYKRKYG